MGKTKQLLADTRYEADERLESQMLDLDSDYKPVDRLTEIVKLLGACGGILKFAIDNDMIDKFLQPRVKEIMNEINDI